LAKIKAQRPIFTKPKNAKLTLVRLAGIEPTTLASTPVFVEVDNLREPNFWE
jgi:hypothetical protein